MRVVTATGDVLEQLDQRNPAAQSGEILLFSCVRNELPRLPYFLDYYRDLGVDRFVIIDNDSADESTGFLMTQPDTHVFHTAASYAGSHYGVHWVNALTDRLAAGHWVAVADADELLVYPYCEHMRLGELTADLDAIGRTALLTFLLDMYAGKPIRDTLYVPGTPFLDTCPYFDSDSYTRPRWGFRRKVPARGGARRRLFWKEGAEFRGKPPYLPKVPLVRWTDGLAYEASTHKIEGVRLAPITGALLHFKMFSDFAENVRIEVERNEQWDSAAQYSVYAHSLAAEPNLNPMYEGSVRYLNSTQLIDLGLMVSR